MENCLDIAIDYSSQRLYSVGNFAGTITNLPGTPSPQAPFTPNGLIVVTDTGGLYLDHTTILSNDIVELYAAVVDDQGFLYVSGSFTDTADFRGKGPSPLPLTSVGQRRMFVAKYDAALNGIWAVTDQVSISSEAKDIAFASGMVVVGGVFDGTLQLDTLLLNTAGGSDGFMLGLDPLTGRGDWVVGLGGNGYDEVNTVAAGFYTAVAGGYFTSDTLRPSGSANFSLGNAAMGTPDAFVATMRIDSGLVGWGARAGGLSEDACYGVSIDYQNVYATGAFASSANFNAAGSLSSAGGNDAFIWALNRGSGASIWARQEGSNQDDFGNDVAADQIGNLYVTGQFAGTVNFGGSISQSSSGMSSIFVTRYLGGGGFDNWATMASNNDNASSSEIISGPGGTYIGGKYFLSVLNFAGAPGVTLPTYNSDNFFVAKIGCGSLMSSNSFTTSNDSTCTGDSVTVTTASQVGLTFMLVDAWTGGFIGSPVAGTGGNITLSTGPLSSSISFQLIVIDSLTKCYDIIGNIAYIEVIPAPVPNLGPDQTICTGDSVVLNPGSFMGYSWNTGSTTPTLTVMNPDTYFVAVKNSLLCSGMDTVIISTVPRPSAFIGDTAACPRTPFPYSASNPAYTYLWSTGGTSMVATIPDTGFYSCTATEGNCSATINFYVFALAEPTVDLGADTSACSGVSILLRANGTPNAQYAWSNGDTGATSTVTTAAWYVVTATNAFTCRDTDSVLVSFNPLPVTSISGIPALMCESEPLFSFSVTPTGGVISGASSTTQLDPAALGPGSFNIRYAYSDSFGCSDTSTVAFGIEALPSLASAGPDQTLTGTDQTILTGNTPAVGTGYWTALNGGNLADANVPSTAVTQLAPGIYDFIWSIYGTACTNNNVDTVRITVIGLQALNIPTGFSPNGDGTNDAWVIRNLPNYPMRSVSIFNRWGALVWATDAYNNDWEGEDSAGSPLGDDTYFFTLDLGDQGRQAGYVVLKR